MAMHQKSPGGCRWCGQVEYFHCSRWSKELSDLTGNGLHQFVHPTQEQIKERMLKRRAKKTEIPEEESQFHESEKEVNISEMGLPRAN